MLEIQARVAFILLVVGFEAQGAFSLTGKLEDINVDEDVETY